MEKVSVAIVVAVIGAAGVVGAAYIQSHPLQEPVPAPSKQVAIPRSSDEPDRFSTLASRQTELDVTGVQIGSADSEMFVVDKRTVFKAKEEVAVTVNYHASARIQYFPVRLTATFGSAMFGGGTQEETADISSPGDSLWTFRFPDNENRVPGKYLLTVQVDGGDVYRQMVDLE